MKWMLECLEGLGCCRINIFLSLSHTLSLSLSLSLSLTNSIKNLKFFNPKIIERMRKKSFIFFIMKFYNAGFVEYSPLTLPVGSKGCFFNQLVFVNWIVSWLGMIKTDEILIF